MEQRIGNIFSTVENGVRVATAFAETGLGILTQAGAHGVSQGVLSFVQGEKVFSAAVSGIAGSLGASAWGGLVGDFSKKALGQIAFGALSGGIGAELTGGNFWQGAVTGGIVAGLNSVMHKMGDPPGYGEKGADKNLKPKDQKNKGLGDSDFIGPGPEIPTNELIKNHGYRVHNEIDNCARIHDDNYLNAGASGVKGALFDLQVTLADAQLVICAANVERGHYSGVIDRFTQKPISLTTMIMAKGVKKVFSPIVGSKGIIKAVINAVKNPGSNPGLYTP